MELKIGLIKNLATISLLPNLILCQPNYDIPQNRLNQKTIEINNQINLNDTINENLINYYDAKIELLKRKRDSLENLLNNSNPLEIKNINNNVNYNENNFENSFNNNINYFENKSINNKVNDDKNNKNLKYIIDENKNINDKVNDDNHKNNKINENKNDYLEKKVIQNNTTQKYNNILYPINTNQLIKPISIINHNDLERKTEAFNLLPEQLKELNDLKKNEYVIWIDKDNQTLSVYQNSSYGLIEVENYLASTGKVKGNKTKRLDAKTPEGNFEIISIHESHNWHYENRLAYGPYFFRLSGEFSRIGIHGTDQPHLLGNNVSLGCIRVSNENVLKLYENYIKIGTKIVISDSKKNKKDYSEVIKNVN
jgi:lipoprotein-anchoring transpeptidase ErfK/SrfK